MEIDQEKIWVVDVEGNGGTPPEIVELAMVQVVALEVTHTQRHYFIQPITPITPYATKIHGITNDEIAGAPAFGDIEDDVLRWLEGSVIVGHNVKVEVDILKRSLPDWLPTKAIDTLRLSRAVLPSLKSHSLANVGEHLGHTAEAERRSGRSHHSAIFDATLTALIFVDLTKRVLSAGQTEILAEADILRSSQGQLF